MSKTTGVNICSTLAGVAFGPDVEPIIMDTIDIDQLISDFSDAVVRASKAGFNGVEIYGDQRQIFFSCNDN